MNPEERVQRPVSQATLEVDNLNVTAPTPPPLGPETASVALSSSTHGVDESPSTEAAPLRGVSSSPIVEGQSQRNDPDSPPATLTPEQEDTSHTPPAQVEALPSGQAQTSFRGWVQDIAVGLRPSGPTVAPVWRQWLAEILYSVISLSSFIIIVTVLRVYGSRPLPSLPMNLTLNTFLAFFATFSKAAFMTLVAESLAQWKWNLASTRHNTIHDFDLVDTASRGPWGAALMIRRFHLDHLVTIAGCLSLISVFTSPITQQMISYQERSTPTEEAAHLVFATEFMVDVHDANLNRRWTIADTAVEGSQNTAGKPIQHLAADRGTSNCTFEPSTSLAVYWTAGGVDSGPLLEGFVFEPVTTAWNASLKPEVDMELVTPLSFAYHFTALNSSIAFNDPDDQFTALSHVYGIWTTAGNVSYPGYDRAADAKPWEFHAIEIFYYFCVNTYKAEYFEGNTTTRVISSSNIPLDIPESQPLPNLDCGTHVPGSDLLLRYCNWTDKRPSFKERHGMVSMQLQGPNDPTGTPSIYRVDHYPAAEMEENIGFSYLLFYMWDGLTTHAAMGLASAASRDIDYILMEPQFPRGAKISESRQYELLGEYFEGMAIALSNMIRSTPPRAQIHQGVAWIRETYVEIQWGWTAFLATELLLSYLFLGFTIYTTRKLGTPVLKSSELATVIAASTDEAGNNVIDPS
ncbi:hypothetical protein OQA88_7165 [Cercophora sp. LCS_1]